MKSINFVMATVGLCVVAMSSSSHAQDATRYRIRVTGVVPDICHATTRSAVVDGDRLIVTLDRMCNRAHVLEVVTGEDEDVQITETRTGRTIGGGAAAFSSASPQRGAETIVIQFEDPDPRTIANATIRISVAPLTA